MKSTRPANRRLGAVLLLAVFWAACGDQGSQSRVPAGTPVILISIDTLRADRLPAYGYTEVRTPAIDGLRADSILFENAYSHVPLTLPSHTSVFTGLLPPDHGLRDNLDVKLEAVDNLPFLPRELQEIGYRTGAMVSTYVLQSKAGLAAGFDVYDDTVDLASKHVRLERPGDETLARAKEWVDTVVGDPFFLFFHIYDPHAPYDPVEPFASRYTDAYDGEVAFSDQVIGQLLDHLKDHGVYDDAIIVLMSDHGEGLGDHGEFQHGVFLYSTTQHVPLMLKLPGSEWGGTSKARPVGLFDIYPTLASLLGLDIAPAVAGVSLLADDVDPDRTIYAETFYARTHFGWSELTSLIGDQYQYIDAPRPELYDLRDDPKQLTDLIQSERRASAELQQQLEQYDRSFQPPAEVDDETRERLASLGYVSTLAQVGDGPLPDPKDKKEVLRLLKESNALGKNGDFDAAIVRLRRVLELEPGMTDAQDRLAKALLNSGRPEQALVAFQQALESSGGQPEQLLLAIANVLTALKRLDEAKEHAALVGEQHEALHLLGYVSALQGNLEEATDYLERSAKQESPPLQQAKLRAAIALAAEDYQSAVDLTIEAEQILEGYDDKAPLRGLYYIRGRAQIQLQQEAAAEQSLLREIEINPSHLQSYAHLALLYAVQNRGPDTGRTLQRMVETNPTPQAYAEAVRTLLFIGDERSAAGVLGQGLGRWPKAPQLIELTSGTQ